MVEISEVSTNKLVIESRLLEGQLVSRQTILLTTTNYKE